MDMTDIEILAALQDDGRITNRDLGELFNLSEAACSRRVTELVRSGVIRRFTAEVDPAARATSVLDNTDLAAPVLTSRRPDGPTPAVRARGG